ncbi:MAG: methyltransferase domain-containing protein [Thermoplasmata archaeon]|uniref:Class I SAM-dependent methyltransferase n=1 Tax=Candidatus Sysuiplasma superficiale TaxID=2823368 RepID=A0A8J7YKS7_9ARCH|nr:class I SAM-dependent methyltransferase [Candidatus Sysuiplasma superficiale]MBX8643546.1 methyltransferase domain-containing protein [Candidatus Sysuiplasma superficiale]
MERITDDTSSMRTRSKDGHSVKHHHSFDGAASFLLSEERRRWQNPSKIADAAGIKQGWNVADLGSGPCFFSLEIASRVGKEGLVYALDSSSVLLSTCCRLASEKGYSNVLPLLADVENTLPIVDGKMDAVFLANVLHDFEKPKAVIDEAGRILKEKGLLIDLDWKKTDTGVGPPVEIRLSEEESSRIITSSVFSRIAVSEAGPFHYMITFRKR